MTMLKHSGFVFVSRLFPRFLYFTGLLRHTSRAIITTVCLGKGKMLSYEIISACIDLLY